MLILFKILYRLRKYQQFWYKVPLSLKKMASKMEKMQFCVVILANFGKVVLCRPLHTKIWANDPWYTYIQFLESPTPQEAAKILALWPLVWPFGLDFFWSKIFFKAICDIVVPCFSVYCWLPFSNPSYKFDPFVV